MDEKHRCSWAGSNPMMQHYHDTEWGVPIRDPRMLWETLILEGFQAGLSWGINIPKTGSYPISPSRWGLHLSQASIACVELRMDSDERERKLCRFRGRGVAFDNAPNKSARILNL